VDSPADPLRWLAVPCLTRSREGTLLHSSHRIELVSEDILASTAIAGVMQNPWPGLHAGTAIHRSEDDSLTWSDPVWLSGLPDAVPLHLSLNTPVAVRGNVLQTSSGRLLISAYTLGEHNTSCLFPSDDDGRAWSYVGPIAEENNETDLGYPHAVSLQDWRVFVVYYLNRKVDVNDRTALRFIEAYVVPE